MPGRILSVHLALDSAFALHEDMHLAFPDLV
jgi:hypothetical protein